MYFRESKNMAIEMILNQGRLVHMDSLKINIGLFVLFLKNVTNRLAYFCFLCAELCEFFVKDL